MTASQNFIPIKEIKDNLVFLKDGTASLVLSTSAVNFGLLFETEQISIIESFAGLLNSLSFPIQIIIISQRLDVSSYLKTLDKAALGQTNPKLKNLTLYYRNYIESIIKEKDVLDKQFYICISVNPVELGLLSKNGGEKGKKAATSLSPRRDHLIRQASRLGLKAKQLNTTELVKLFYGIYNPVANGKAGQGEGKEASKNTNFPLPSPNWSPSPSPNSPPPPPPSPLPSVSPSQPPPPAPTPPITSNLHPPFVVEELSDDFGP